MKTTLIIPTLNEIDGLRAILPRIKKEWVDQILIVDGHSSDGTVEYARNNEYTVILQKNKGIRYGYIDALEYIEGDVVITFSPDGNSIPELIPPLIEKMKEGYDMVVVSRYAEGARSYDDDLITAFGNWLYTFIINLLFKSKYTDALVMFRAWKKEIFYALDLDKDESYSLEERVLHTIVGVDHLMSIRAAKRKLKCCDIPGDEPRRIGGERKLQVFKWGIAIFYEICREVFFWH